MALSRHVPEQGTFVPSPGRGINETIHLSPIQELLLMSDGGRLRSCNSDLIHVADKTEDDRRDQVLIEDLIGP